MNCKESHEFALVMQNLKQYLTILIKWNLDPYYKVRIGEKACFLTSQSQVGTIELRSLSLINPTFAVCSLWRRKLYS